MSEPPTLLYLEADDEITTVVRRVRAAPPGRVVIVAPGRSRATSSAVALRLLVRAGEEEGRALAVVGDGLTRSLAAEAGMAAYISVEDARGAQAREPEAAETRHAAIHVVRGPAPDETAPTVVAASPVSAPDTETRAVSVAPQPTAVPQRARPARTRRRRRVAPLVIVLVIAATVLLGAVVAAATLLPSATIRITPRSEPVGPVRYEITVGDAERTSGTVTATATVTATGSYAVQAAASGAVTFRNFNIVPVEVPAGTGVAAGETTFMTNEAVVVPPGSLTGDGTIAGGEASVGITAQAIGEGGNLVAEAIDTILDPQTRNRLRGFPQNAARLVVNAEPTAGGIDATGLEITQADVDAALAALHEALALRVSEALEGTDDGLFADVVDAPEPVIRGVEGLVGTRDQEQAEISGELAYDRLTVDEGEIEARARERFASDATNVPEGHELLTDVTEVGVAAVRREGDSLVAAVDVSGRSAPTVDRAEVIERAIGRSEDEARAALADLGEATVELWPGWVASVPGNEWRIEVVITGVDERELDRSGS